MFALLWMTDCMVRLRIIDVPSSFIRPSKKVKSCKYPELLPTIVKAVSEGKYFIAFALTIKELKFCMVRLSNRGNGCVMVVRSTAE